MMGGTAQAGNTLFHRGHGRCESAVRPAAPSSQAREGAQHSPSRLAKQGAERYTEGVEIALDDAPDDAAVNAGIRMDQDVAEADDV